MTKNEQWLLDEKYGGVPTEEYEKDKDRLASGEPVGYVIGWQPFLGLTIHLDSPYSAKATKGTRPLIPRPETEWWTEQLLTTDGMSARRESHSATAREEAIFQQKNTPLSSNGLPEAPLRFLDLCAGSGAIGCAVLARVPNAQVCFGEIDPAHAPTILKNIRENHLDETRADIRTGDLFAPFANMQFDVIAVNPPYIPSERMLDDSVAKFEPHEALFSGVDGLDLICRIARGLSAHLAPRGTAWVECDISNIESAQTIFIKQGFNATIRTDQYGVQRILVVSFPI